MRSPFVASPPSAFRCVLVRRWLAVSMRALIHLLASQSTAPNIGPLLALIRRHVQPLQTPWLVPHLTSSTLKASTAPAVLIPTHVKHLRTTAPLNPKAASTAKKLAKKEKKLGKPEVYVAEEEE